MQSTPRWHRSAGLLVLLCLISTFIGPEPVVAVAPPSFNPPDYTRSGLLQEVLSRSTGGPSLGIDDLNSEASGICRPTGHIEDAQCDYETVEAINARFFSRLSNIVKKRYFRFYKTDLYKDCPFWIDNSLCMNRDCTVQKAEEVSSFEVPKITRWSTDTSSVQSEIPEEYRTSHLSSVSSTFSTHEHEGHDSSCSCRDTDFCHWDDENSDEAVYVDLLKNPERFTGYAGPSANRVWKSIYEENCFGAAGAFTEPPRSKTSGGGTGFPHLSSSKSVGGRAGGGNLMSSGLDSLVSALQAPADPGDSEVCLEKRIFYRIISGLHASISIHICADYLDQQTGIWSPNLDCFIARIAHHPERLQNVYFNYVLLLRALARAGEQTTLQKNLLLLPGDEIEEDATRQDLASLLQSASNIPTTFDEHSMFAGPDARGLKQEFKARFRNVSSIMDCVGCDKCRLWGKLQTNGLATALKILFSYGDTASVGETGGEGLLRSELVALINTAHRFAESLKAVETFRDLYQKRLEEKTQTEVEADTQPAPRIKSASTPSSPSQGGALDDKANGTAGSRSAPGGSSEASLLKKLSAHLNKLFHTYLRWLKNTASEHGRLPWEL